MGWGHGWNGGAKQHPFSHQIDRIIMRTIGDSPCSRKKIYERMSKGEWNLVKVVAEYSEDDMDHISLIGKCVERLVLTGAIMLDEFGLYSLERPEFMARKMIEDYHEWFDLVILDKLSERVPRSSLVIIGAIEEGDPGLVERWKRVSISRNKPAATFGKALQRRLRLMSDDGLTSYLTTQKGWVKKRKARDYESGLSIEDYRNSGAVVESIADWSRAWRNGPCAEGRSDRGGGPIWVPHSERGVEIGVGNVPSVRDVSGVDVEMPAVNGYHGSVPDLCGDAAEGAA